MSPKLITTEEALLSISEGISYAARNPNIKHYKPHEKQYIFHKSTKKKKLYIGGNRSGKTVGGVVEDIWRASCTHPYRPDLNAIGPNRGRVVAVDFNKGVEQIIFPQFKQWLYPSIMRGGSWETAYDKSLRVLTFTNQSTIEFMSYDQDLDKFAGTSRHWVHFDEEPPKSIFMECGARLIDTYGDFYITMTPVEGMTWVYDDLYEPNINDADSPVEIIEIDMEENPYLMKEAIDDYIGSLDEDDRIARKSGKFVTVGGRVYKKFDPTVGGLHVLKDPIDDIQDFLKGKLLVEGLDHGLNNPTAVLWVAYDEQGFGTVVWEHYKKEWTVDKHASEIKRIEQFLGREPDIRVADPSIQNRSPISGTSIQQEYISHGLPFTLANNDIKSGIVRVKRYFNPSVPPSVKHPLGQKPRLLVDPRCQNTIWEHKRYHWKVYRQKALNYENNAYEEPHKKDDHTCDALRYITMTRPDLRSTHEEDHLAEVRSIMENFTPMTTAPQEFSRADPFDLTSDPNWNEYNSVPNSNSDGWEYDEHMGGIW